MNARSLSKDSKKAKPKKPEKPHKDFPLTPHARGQWCKKVAGQLYYFGRWDDPEGAVNEWLARKDGIFAGIDHERFGDHPTDPSACDVAYLCNEFLEAKKQQLESNDIAQVTYDDYEAASDRFVAFFGKRRKLEGFKPEDFRRYRASWPKTWGSSSTNNEIAKVRLILNFGFDSGIVDKPFRTGPSFKRVSRKNQRLERQKKPKRLFEAAEIHQLIASADPQLHAMILLGINAGYGNADCGRLTISSIDFERSWLEGLREKTAIERAAWLWPETIEAIQKAIEQRYDNHPSTLADHVFITKRRQAWFRGSGKDDAVTAAFAKLRTKALIDPAVKLAVEAGADEKVVRSQEQAKRRGVNFYSLRHSFETVAGDSKDQIAVNYVMGHCDDSMAAVYREGIDPQRIIDVCSFVRDWFLEGEVTK